MDVSKGEIVTIVGPNGSGKSTLLRAIVGSVIPATGSVSKPTGMTIGYVPQTLSLHPGLPLTVRRFLSLPIPVSDDAAAKALELTGADNLGAAAMSSLSGGQFQRVLLARAVLGSPDLLLLDEPTQGLDQPGSAAFYRLIDTLRHEIGCAVVMVSHELHVVMSASDRVICLNGHICCEGTPEVVSNAPEYRALFGTLTGGALALYRHEHDHDHAGAHTHDHAHDPSHGPGRDA
jgi:zinc transport system ATP-binding protein